MLLYQLVKSSGKKIITICSSASFYKEVTDLANQIKKMGFNVRIPKAALEMKESGNFKVSDYKTWLKDDSLFHLKKSLMDDHFKKVTTSDAIFVLNLDKKGIRGYIGGNGLMEMAIAYVNKKPIFIWKMIDKKSPVYEEVLGLSPTFINSDLSNIRL